MIERLNFYDLYGYLLPGLTLITLLWLPYRIVSAEVPLPTALSSVLLTASVAYLVGHVLQALAREAWVRGRSPNDFLLDNSDETLSKTFKDQLIVKIQTRFEIEVNVDDGSDTSRKVRRNDAFLQCRAVLLQNKAGLYAEQFQGMYALMRGVAAASLLGAAYNLGWFISWLLSPSWNNWLLVLLLIGWVIAVLFFLAYELVIPRLRLCYKDKVDHGLSTDHRIKKLLDAAFDFRAKLRLGGVVLLLVPVGCWLGLKKVTCADSSLRLLAFALVALFVWVICDEAYLHFAKGFAATVYRDFASLQENSTNAK